MSRVISCIAVTCKLMFCLKGNFLAAYLANIDCEQLGLIGAYTEIYQKRISLSCICCKIGYRKGKAEKINFVFFFSVFVVVFPFREPSRRGLQAYEIIPESRTGILFL